MTQMPIDGEAAPPMSFYARTEDILVWEKTGEMSRVASFCQDIRKAAAWSDRRILVNANGSTLVCGPFLMPQINTD